MRIFWLLVSACLGFFSFYSAPCIVGRRFLIALTALAFLRAAFYLPIVWPLTWISGLWCLIGVAVGFICVMVACFILTSFSRPAKGNERVILVLGVVLENGDRIGPLLEKRLCAALDALHQRPSLIAVLSGGRVEGETIAEARAMEIWMLNHGVAAEQLIVEDASLTTKENFQNARMLLEARGHLTGEPYAVVTNRFHCFRVKDYAAGAGFGDIRLLPASTGWLQAPAWYLREVLVTIKYWITGA